MAHPLEAILITGGAGFIGSTLVRQCLARECRVVTLDKLTYAGHRDSLAEILDHPKHTLIEGDIADAKLVSEVLVEHRPRSIVHLAAESHVDRSIANPPQFAITNVVGTCVLLDVATRYWQSLDAATQSAFRFLQISTDEVFGSAGPSDTFDEQSPLRPNSPYAASKAAAEHFAHAFGHTFGLPVIVVNPGNNYGPRQHPEKLIPKMIHAASQGQALRIYGDGLQERDWLHVDDCCDAMIAILEKGTAGSRYLVGADCCLSNLRVTEVICDLVAEMQAKSSRSDLIMHVADRPGHDRRYAIDASLLEAQIGWRPKTEFAEGLRQTVKWYMDNPKWIEAVVAKEGLT